MDQASKCFETDARVWARQQWLGVNLQDNRLERRALEIGYRLALRPAATLARQMQDKAQLKAAYRLLDNAHVSYAALSRPHWQATRQAAGQLPWVLLVQDGSELDYSPYAETMAGLGSVGDNRYNRGLLLHTTLAVVPAMRRVLGIAHQQVLTRQLIPKGTDRRRRPKAERESRVWGEALRAIGAPPAGVRWVVVADRGADDIAYLDRCQRLGYDFCIRMAYERRLMNEDDPARYLLTTARSWPVQVRKTLAIRGKGGRPARQAELVISYAPVTLRVRRKHVEELAVWIVRAWEPKPPEGVEALEWILATTVPILSCQDALARLDWYTVRWVVEDYHQCLKTGCAIERRDFEKAARIERLLGFLAVIAVRLLQLRQDVRLVPETPATALVEPLLVNLLAAKLNLAPAAMTIRSFWRGVAQLGGFVGRRSDGDPGWKTLWRGWLQLQDLAEGARLAASLPYT